MTDFLGQAADLTVRGNGGTNAGPTIDFSGHSFMMRLIP
ncbi:hypothetical protein, partial [Lactobacillus jensenii]